MNQTVLVCSLVCTAVSATYSATAGAALGTSSPPAAKIPAVKLDPIPGSTAKRVTLAPRAAERLGIEVGKVDEESLVRRQFVGGLVIPPLQDGVELRTASALGESEGAPQRARLAQAAGPGQSAAAPTKYGSFPPVQTLGRGVDTGFGSVARAAPAPAPAQAVQPASPQPATAPAEPPAPSTQRTSVPIAGDAWVAVTLSQGEWDRLAKDKSVRLLPLATRDQPANVITATPSGRPPVEDQRRSMLTVYYVVAGAQHGLAVNKRMRVEMQLAGDEQKQKVVPYSAIYYDAKGSPWVYVNKQPYVFERQRVSIDRIAADRAVLSDGPPMGTPVVTVGAALLYGAELFGK